MTITAKMIADSISPDGIRLSTLQLRYPKFIHGEFMTHRVFSRNASSSRAIPVSRLVEDVLLDPAMPIHWGKNQKGMQADHENDEPVVMGHKEGEYLRGTPQEAWLAARDRAVAQAQAFTAAGYHKQIVNRLLEPYCHINVVVTATEFSNFFALRDHPDAQPEIAELAKRMKEAMNTSTPQLLPPEEWHLPYVPEDLKTYLCSKTYLYKASDVPPYIDQLRRISVARCARVSYLTQDGKTPSIEEDLQLCERLLAGVPLHASPAEHQGTPDKRSNEFPGLWCDPSLHGNFRGWIQYRKTLPGECQ